MHPKVVCFGEIMMRLSPPGLQRFVQALLTGEECIDVTFDRQLPLLQDYQAEKDLLFVASPPEYASLPMKPGYFAIFFPQDIHRPNCQLHGKQAVRKIVMKVRAA